MSCAGWWTYDPVAKPRQRRPACSRLPTPAQRPTASLRTAHVPRLRSLPVPRGPGRGFDRPGTADWRPMTDPTNYPKGNQMSEPTTIVRYLAGTTAQCGPITPVLNHCVDRCGFAAPEGSDDWADHLRDCSVRRAIAKASARARSAPQQGLRLNGWRYKTPAGTCPVGHQLFEGLAHECFSRRRLVRLQCPTKSTVCSRD